ncbi:MFS family permease [Halapricum desulfuricans]|uniref:MFS family permease n=1 Tax=Halapricum desulfuricans TaxID=2841257 RepID=A0A897NI18_9EURY|nr:MFS transporter [Halapricum desulfuricans]QSG10613.1 MFS family permease [Halapricum desulfuricans]
MTRRRLFGSLCTLVFLVNLARVVFAPLVEPLQAAFTTTNATIGLTVTLAWLGSALPRIPTGYLLTRVPRHYVVGATGLVLAAASAFIAAADTVPEVMVGAFLMGIASGAYFIAANPLVSELFPRRVGTALGVHGMASQIGAAVASLLVSVALFVGDWRTTFHAIGLAALLSTVGFALMARRTQLPEAGTDDRDLLAAVRHQWRIVLAGVVVISASGFVWQGVFNFLDSYLRTRGFSGGDARLLLTGVFAAGVPAFAVTGWLADRVRIVPLLLSILAGFALCVFALTLPFGTVWVVAVALVMGYVIHSLFPAMDTYLLGSLPDRHRASAYAVYSGTMMLVQATGSWAVGLLTDAGFSFPLIYRSFAVGLAVVLLALVVTYRAGRLPTGARA